MRQFHLARFATKPSREDVESQIDPRFGEIVLTEIYQSTKISFIRNSDREMLLDQACTARLSGDWVAIVETEDGLEMDKNGHPVKR